MLEEVQRGVLEAEESLAGVALGERDMAIDPLWGAGGLLTERPDGAGAARVHRAVPAAGDSPSGSAHPLAPWFGCRRCGAGHCDVDASAPVMAGRRVVIAALRPRQAHRQGS
jgi:hypothetical protein